MLQGNILNFPEVTDRFQHNEGVVQAMMFNPDFSSRTEPLILWPLEKNQILQVHRPIWDKSEGPAQL